MINILRIEKKQLNRILFMVLIIAVASLGIPRFVDAQNITNLSRQIFLLTLMGYGMALSMLIGGIDLSIGSVAALTSVLSASIIINVNPVLGVLCGLAMGAFLGFVNGFFIAHFGIPDFIMTFSMQYIARGLALTYTQGEAFYSFPRSFKWIGKGFIGPIPVPILISLGVLLILAFVLNKTTFGRAVYAVGVNKRAAKYTGINVKKKVTQVYTLSGLIAAAAGLMFIARLNSADADLGISWPLEAIAVCVVGGVTFLGGEGKISGLVVGGIVMAILGNCVNLLGIPPRFQDFFNGFIIILAVTVDHYTASRTVSTRISTKGDKAAADSDSSSGN